MPALSKAIEQIGLRFFHRSCNQFVVTVIG